MWLFFDPLIICGKQSGQWEVSLVIPAPQMNMSVQVKGHRALGLLFVPTVSGFAQTAPWWWWGGALPSETSVRYLLYLLFLLFSS